MTNINIVDMIMGAGKTSAMINYINEAPKDVRFLYITPYLSEVDRIITSCPDKKFTTPYPEKGRKLQGLKTLLNKGRNIVSTHSLFQKFDQQLIDICRANNYILILDEVADVIEKYDISKDDMNTLMEKYVTLDSSGFLKWREEERGYTGKKFTNEKRLCDLNCLACYGENIMMWLFPVEVFNAFSDIFILTYMFKSQLQCYYYKYYNLEFHNLYVTEDYHFTQEHQLISYNFQNLIHIVDNPRMNKIGDLPFDLSKAWYQRNEGNTPMSQLKNHLINFFRHQRKAKTGDCLWTTFKDYRKCITSKGFGRAFIPINTRASNEYRERTSVAYLVNRFLDPNIKNFFITNNIQVDEDGYALSEMLQFIWRSAIREGKEIWIYVPSKRMRDLLKNWITSEASGEASSGANE